MRAHLECMVWFAARHTKDLAEVPWLQAECARLQWQAEQEAARQAELQDHCRKQQQAESMMEANR